jgi:dTDP-4-amino-4,6-dideoxygalactose transaminase
MNNKKEIFCTLGPSTFNKDFLKFSNNKISLLRLNMSHIKIKGLKRTIMFIRKYSKVPICIDTEGAQIRTIIRKRGKYKTNQRLSIYKNKGNFNVYPSEVFDKIKKNDFLSIGFDGLEIKVMKANQNILRCRVIKGGTIENNKGIHLINRSIRLNFLTEKDKIAINMAKKMSINHYALSFTNTHKDILKFDKLLKNKIKIFKLETKSALKNLNKIITINRKTGKRIVALIVVHLFGNVVEIDKLLRICKKKNISLIEDAAESVGSFYYSGKYRNRHTGTVGKIGCLSFNGNKIITAGGGGMILTNDLKIAKRAKYLTTQAKDDNINYIHNDIGYNFRLSNLQAALGIAQLESLPSYIRRKRKIHKIYKKKINKIAGLRVSETSNSSKCNYWLNIVEFKKKISKNIFLKIIKYLQKNGIQARPIWYPNHLQRKYKNCQTYRLDNIQKIYQNRLCIPSSSQLTKNQQNFVCDKIKNVYEKFIN